MATGKACGMLLLLACAASILLGNLAVGVVEPCPLVCLDVSYVTCPSSGNQQLSPSCNCCRLQKGCILHLSDGSTVTCS
ncbi:hypothetical protein MLD38_033706 [Melastoma candidum]|uniref:Uncharacterized protein n=1 Tax=Melastoma candidum TaxID=119954 RepID=A0ACB9M7R4_9MYRT|nr:hypothetical protein MLD38_033706 [Melastoma candidum]